MARRSGSIRLNLPTQGLIVLVSMIVLTSSAIGIPAVWLFREQLDRQAQELADQGSQMADALIEARHLEVGKLAVLTAQRPTLAQLLQPGETGSLAAYLEGLRVGAGLDLVMVCHTGEGASTQVGLPIAVQVCRAGAADGFYRAEPGADPPGWLLAAQPVPDRPGEVVIVGQAFDSEFFDQLRVRIGMEHLLVLNGELLGGSFPDDTAAWEAISDRQAEEAALAGLSAEAQTLYIRGTPYFTAGSEYAGTGLETIVFLAGTLTSETQARLTRTAGAGILLVVALCSFLAVLVARQVSLPLVRLRDAATALRKGDLVTPIIARTRVNEISQLAYSLEDARIALLHTLQELRQEKAWADHLLESVSEGIITLDRQGRITFFSQGAQRITGWSEEQVLGKPVDEVFRLADREARFSQRLPLPGAKQEIVTILAKETPVTLAMTAAALTPPQAGKASLALSIRDISHEEAMRGLLGDFLANVTHEFRTPLTALAASIELLLDQLPDLSADELHELLVSNHIGVLSLQNLIDNLLEGASIEAGRFHVSLRPAEITGVIQEAVGVMQPLLEKNQQNLRPDLAPDLPPVRIDPRRTTQVLVNLLSNAVKWSPRGSEILLSAFPAGCHVRVAVADRGPGISPEHKPDLFTRFAQIRSADSQAGYGAGLGLSVVRAIVEAQEGQVGVEDRPDGGTVFWFTVPSLDLGTGEEEVDP